MRTDCELKMSEMEWAAWALCGRSITEARHLNNGVVECWTRVNGT